MPNSTYYVQECPTCGRNLQIRLEYLGKQVVCQHCSACFEACEPGSDAYPPADSSLSLLQRADELLESASTSGSMVSQTVFSNASVTSSSSVTGTSAPVRPK